VLQSPSKAHRGDLIALMLRVVKVRCVMAASRDHLHQFLEVALRFAALETAQDITNYSDPRTTGQNLV
jgi:hypothetical protein